MPVTGRDFEEALRGCDERCTTIAAKGHDAVNPLRALDLPRETPSREAIGKCVALLWTRGLDGWSMVTGGTMWLSVAAVIGELGRNLKEEDR